MDQPTFVFKVVACDNFIFVKPVFALHIQNN